MITSRLSVHAQRERFRRKAVALGVALAISSPAFSNPSGLSVVAGQVTAQTIGNLMQVTNTPGAILNWQQFNIDVGQTTQFIQQNAASQVFNRVVGGDVSRILGTLQSNGQVFLINPAGVLFGQGAVVDTAGFLASSLAASNTDLMKGHLHFDNAGGQAGAIVNQGKLTTHSGGSIVLLAPSIENSGLIHSDGEVLLAAGHSVTIVDLKHPTIGLTVSVQEGEQAVNLGQIISKNASVFSHLVKNSGVVEATGAELGQGGVIRFVAQGDALVSGQVLAQGESGRGGEIDITGQRVGVLSGARISADGATGGGTVHVGGGWKGQDKSISNAQETVVQANTRISANATGQGNGGEVVIWADGRTTVDSEIQAKGGSAGGNGGRVETSGKQTLAVNVAANTSAANGKAGQWLIDPANLTIVDQIPANENNLENSTQGPVFSTDDISSTFSPTESFLLASTVVAGIENNGFVEIYTTGTQPGEGNLRIEAPVLVSNNTAEIEGNPRLLLEANGMVDINASVGLMPGQTTFDGFDLTVSYDIAKPVYVDAPLLLGNSGTLTLAPYEQAGGSTLPTSLPGELPRDGVNFLSGMNSGMGGQPLLINRIVVAPAIATDPFTEAPLQVSPEKPVKLNVLGARLDVNQLNAFAFSTGPQTDLRVGADPFAEMSAPVQGSLNYNILEARSLTVDAGSSVSTFTRSIDGGQTLPAAPTTFLDTLVSRGTVQFNGGFSNINSLQVEAGSVNFGNEPDPASASSDTHVVQNLNLAQGATLNLTGANMSYGKAVIDGTFNVLGNSDTGSFLSGTFFLDGVDTDLNGQFNLGSRNQFVYLQSLGMGSNSEIRIGQGAFLGLGTAFGSSLAPVEIVAKQAGAVISSTNGQFVAQQGSRIVMNGATEPFVFIPSFIQPSETESFFGPGGARLDITGLDGQLNAPIIIQSNGYSNAILTASENFDFNSDSTIGTPIPVMTINSADIRVNAGGDGPALRIGGIAFSESSDTRSRTPVGLDFNGSLTVNSGRVWLEGSSVSITDASVNVSGQNSRVVLSGKFTTADLQTVNRTSGGQLGAAGFWDNSQVNSSNAATFSPLSKGNILVVDDLTVSGGLLTSAGTSNALKVTPDGFLILNNTEVSGNIDLAPESGMMLGAQDTTGAPTAPVVLNNANINMGGDAFLIVETDAAGVASLGGTATISSGQQGNLILAGRRVFDQAGAPNAPEAMSLSVGSGIRLNVTGDSPSLPPGLARYYAERGIATPPGRPVFTVGQLTPEAVAIAEYDELASPPVTTVLTGFANPSFVVDGTPDVFTQGSLDCFINNFCVKFDVAQSLTYSGMVMSTLGAPAPTLANSGVAFVAGANLSGLQYAVSSPDEIVFMQGLNTLTVADLVSGKRLVNAPGSTVRFGSNTTNESISNDLQNNGILELQGNYTLSGVLTGTGVLNNTGTLILGNGSGSLITNSIVNTGSINNVGNYTFGGVLAGTGSLLNNGTLNLTGSGLFQNSIANSGGGTLSFAGSGQNVQFTGTFTNTSTVAFNGGQFDFGNGGYVQSGGNLIVQPGTTLTGNLNVNGGALRGFATIDGNLNVQGGRLVPGASPGLMTINGDLSLNANSVTDIEIQSDGGVPGVDFDCIVVNGTANLNGQLNLLDISGGELAVGNQYAFLQASSINGAFTTVNTSPANAAYNFSAPVLEVGQGIQRLTTSTVATTPPPVEPPPPVQPPPPVGPGPDFNSPETFSQSTGDSGTAVAQNLNQAFVPPPASQPAPDRGPAPANQQPVQKERAEERANQSTGGTTISQRSNNIEFKSMPSNPRRAAAVCK